MKRQYLKPCVDLTLMTTAGMVATSLALVDDGVSNESELLSRERRHKSVWDDDEEE